jgi:hypothetical protein
MNSLDFFALYEEAVQTGSPYFPALRTTVKDLLKMGVDRKVLINSLLDYRDKLHDEQRDLEEDRVLIILDDLEGWRKDLIDPL